MTSLLSTYMRFFWAGLVKHGQTGGIIPSQRYLIDRMIAPIPTSYRGRVLELGTGTGALTLRLAAKCPDIQILACEINPVLAQTRRDNLAKAGRLSRVDVRTVAADFLLSKAGFDGLEKPDFILSGIPLGNLGKEKAARLLSSIHSALGYGGTYIQFQHSLLDHRKIKKLFHKLRTIPVFLNFPPAVVYFAYK